MTNLISTLYSIVEHKTKAIFTLALASLGFVSIPTYSQDLESLQVIQGVNSIGDLITIVQNFLVSLAAPLSVLVIIIGGFKYFLGANDEGKTNGRKTINAGVVGLVIVLMAQAISGLVRSVFSGGAENPIDARPLVEFINRSLIGNLTLLAVAVATLAMIYGGYKDFIKAFDEKTSGTEAVKVSIFGISVIFLAGAFANTIQAALTGTSDLGEGINKLVESFTPILQSTTGLLTALATVVSALVIAKGGFDYYAGAIGQKAKGLETIQKGVIGLSVTLLSGFIANTIANVFGETDNVANIFDFGTLPTTGAGVLGAVLNNGIDFLLTMASIGAVAVIVFGAYQYYLAAIPDSKVKGITTIQNGAIGLIVTILARPLVTLIQQTFAITDTQDLSSYELSLDPEAITNLIKGILTNLVIPLSSVVAVFFLVLGSYYWITSNGKDEQVKKAKTAMTNAVIGLVIALMCTTIVQLIIFFVQPGEFIEADQNTAGQSFTSSSQTDTSTNNSIINSQPTPDI